MPDVLYFERGIWQSAALLTGNAPLSFAEITQGLKEFGIKFIHAIRPRSKTVERVGGLLQDRMEGEPGYCGREERKDAPERLGAQRFAVEREANKAEPDAAVLSNFYSFEQWNRRLGEIIAHYNAEPQQGRILRGLSPEQALEKFLDHSNPPISFDARTRARASCLPTTNAACQ